MITACCPASPTRSTHGWCPNALGHGRARAGRSARARGSSCTSRSAPPGVRCSRGASQRLLGEQVALQPQRAGAGDERERVGQGEAGSGRTSCPCARGTPARRRCARRPAGRRTAGPGCSSRPDLGSRGSISTASTCRAPLPQRDGDVGAGAGADDQHVAAARWPAAARTAARTAAPTARRAAAGMTCWCGTPLTLMSARSRPPRVVGAPCSTATSCARRRAALSTASVATHERRHRARASDGRSRPEQQRRRAPRRRRPTRPAGRRRKDSAVNAADPDQAADQVEPVGLSRGSSGKHGRRARPGPARITAAAPKRIGRISQVGGPVVVRLVK